MMYKKEKPVIMILGGYGGVGSLITTLIIENTDAVVIVSGRTEMKCTDFVNKISTKYNCAGRISSRTVDIEKVRESDFIGVDLVVHATTANRHLLPLGKAVIGGGADFIDLSMKHVLSEIETEIISKQRTVIVQAGFHPGLPATFTRHIASKFEKYISAKVSMAMEAVEFNSPESVNELIYLVGDWSARVCTGGNWRKANFKDVITTDFGAPWGVRDCFPLDMVEMEEMTKKYGISEAGVYVLGFNWFVDMLVFPLIMLAYKVKRGLGDSLWRRLLFWGLKRFSKGEKGVVFILDAIGQTNGEEKRVRMIAKHDDPYLFTAVPVFSCIRQYLAGTIRKPGLYMMGHVIDTDELVRDMTEFGIFVSIEKT
jgi:hypothetical protein